MAVNFIKTAGESGGKVVKKSRLEVKWLAWAGGGGWGAAAAAAGAAAAATAG